MATWPILSVTTFLPLVGAVFILLLRGDDEAAKRNARWVALWTTVVTFIVSIFLITGFDKSNPGFQFVEDHPWLGGTIRYKMGVDGISLPFVILTTFLMPITILSAWHAIEKRVKEFMVL
ncbi:MAG: NADH-quinone oxidoreductase subunit M, partial [Xanthobacteraceae bacterium]|nr:NADH-quinone oxidoreductase subunit M [Xanthobacteraceae bacterium]